MAGATGAAVHPVIQGRYFGERQGVLYFDESVTAAIGIAADSDRDV